MASRAFYVIVGIVKDKNIRKFNILETKLLTNSAGECKWAFKPFQASEEQVVAQLRDNNNTTEFFNCALDDSGKIVGTQGSLSRFEDSKKPPCVILSKLVTTNGKLIGYKLVKPNGTVSNIRLKDVISFGARATKDGAIPVQNAIYTPATAEKSAYFKAYPGKEFINEVIVNNANKHTEVRQPSIQKNKSTLSKLEEIYTKDQIAVLKKGKADGLDIRVFANPQLSSEQMKILSKGMRQGVKVNEIAFPEFKPECMKYYIMERKNGTEIELFLNPKYNVEQLSELSLAAEEGLDLSIMSNPSFTPDDMQQIRIRLEKNLFKSVSFSKFGELSQAEVQNM